jgi:hypothetical protein
MSGDMAYALRMLVTGDPAVSALIANRYYPQVFPERATLPLVVRTRISLTSLYDLAGDANVTTRRVQLDSWGRTQDEVDTLAAALRTVLSGYRGALDAVHITSIFLDNELDAYQADTRLWRSIQEYLVTYEEI